MQRRRLEGTQTEHVRALLMAGKRLNHVNLIRDCGGKAGWRLGAAIHRLATDKDDPLVIIREYTGRERRATYFLDPQCRRDPAQLGLQL
mgnify:CR=1 FL=1